MRAQLRRQWAIREAGPGSRRGLARERERCGSAPHARGLARATWSPVGLGKRCAQKCARRLSSWPSPEARSAGNGGQRRAEHMRDADRAPRAAAAFSGPPGARVCTKAENARIHEMSSFQGPENWTFNGIRRFSERGSRRAWRDMPKTRDSRQHARGPVAIGNLITCPPPHALRLPALGHRAPGPRARPFTDFTAEIPSCALCAQLRNCACAQAGRRAADGRGAGRGARARTRQAGA